MKVIKPVTIFHAKAAASLQLEGMEGVMVKNVTFYKEQTVSATLPYKVELMPVGAEGKPIKVLVHMVSSRAYEWLLDWGLESKAEFCGSG